MSGSPSSSIATGLLLPGVSLSNMGFTWSVPTAGSSFSYAGEANASGYAVLTLAQVAAFAAAIQAWDDLIAPDFTRTDDAAAPGAIRIAFTNYAKIDGDFAYTYFPAPDGGAVEPIHGDIWLNATYGGEDFAQGTYNFAALIHELGHALGLRHTHEAPGFDAAFDSAVYSVMSYEHTTFTAWSMTNVGGRLEITSEEVHAAGPMVLDIAAVQARYGAEQKTAAGDDVYVLSDATPFLKSIYDAAGDDTLDASRVTRGSVIDLAPGAYSSIGQFSIADQIAAAEAQYGAAAAKLLAQRLAQPDAYTFTDNLGIAFSTVIENAIGGAGDDRISGNAAANRLEGGAGADSLFGLLGDDFLIGGAGDDLIDGGEGADTAVYAVSSSAAHWTQNADGSWTVTVDGFGQDTLRGVEALHFNDRTIDLLAPSQPAPVKVGSAATLDFTGDGKSDLLWQGPAGEVKVWTAGMRGAFAEQALGAASAEWQVAAACDFNGDGKADLAWRNASGEVVIWNSAAQGYSGAYAGVIPNDWSIKGSGDFNGDGRGDILWRNTAGDVVLWNAQASGFSGQFAGRVGADWSIAGVADFTGDGKADIFWRGQGGEVVIWDAQSGGFSGRFAGAVGAGWTVQAAADFTGDGKADILWRDGTGTVVMWASGAAGFQGVLAGSQGVDWTAAQAADLNGDGKADLVWRDAGGTLALWTAGQSAGQFATQLIGQGGGGWQLFGA